MRVENSPGYEAKMTKRDQQRKHETQRHARHLKKAFAPCTVKIPWQPISKCPFDALDHEYGFDGSILVTDSDQIALATVKRRFGKPMYWTGDKPPEMVYRDGGMAYEGEGTWKKPDNPKWWFKWELTDVYGIMTYASGHETGKEEIPFVATHWFPLVAISPA